MADCVIFATGVMIGMLIGVCLASYKVSRAARGPTPPETT